MVIALDGPAGAGKSSVARAVAAALGFTYLDSGAMYRCVGLAHTRAGIRREPGELAEAADIELRPDGSVFLDGSDVTSAIRTPSASTAASAVSADPRVRKALVAKQQQLMTTGDWVAEGRDIGTVVAPHAELKVFLTASPEERAQRRAAELGLDVGEVLEQQLARDERDEQREHSPLQQAPDAVLVDTTGTPLDEVVRRIVMLAQQRRVRA